MLPTLSGILQSSLVTRSDPYEMSRIQDRLHVVSQEKRDTTMRIPESQELKGAPHLAPVTELVS